MRKVLVFAVLAAATAFAMTGIATAEHTTPGSAVAPSFVPGKVSNDCEGGTKLEGDITSGTYDLFFPNVGTGMTLTLTITVVQTSQGPSFTFVSADNDEIVTSMYVKGGPDGSNLYNYGSFPNGGVAHDDGLHSPLNPKNKNDQWYGLSHLCIFADKL